MKGIKCKSGRTGWQCRLQKNYLSLEEFKSYNINSNITKRLGFKTAEEAWAKNPMIQGSVDPSDLCVVDETTIVKKERKMGVRRMKDTVDIIVTEIRDNINDKADKLARIKATYQFSKGQRAKLERFVQLGKELNKEFNKISDNVNFAEQLMSDVVYEKRAINEMESRIRGEVANKKFKNGTRFELAEFVRKSLEKESIKPGFELAKWTEEVKAKYIK